MSNLIPTHYSDHEKYLDSVSQVVRDRIAADIWNAPLLDPMRCDARFLQALGKFYGIEYWWDDLTEEEQRNFIMKMPLIKKRRGTLWAVKEALKVIDADGHVLEGDYTVRYDGSSLYNGIKQHGYVTHWAEYIVIASRPMINAQASQLRNMIESVAPVRSHLKRIDYTAVANNYNGAINYDGNYNYGGA